MSIFIITLVGLWVLAVVVLSGQMARIWRLDFATVGAMTVSQVCRTSRRGAVITFMALITLSWPLCLEINVWDRAVFRDGKLVRVFDSGAVMLQGTWNKTTAGADVASLTDGEISAGTAVEIQCPGNGATNGVLIIKIDGRNQLDDILKRLGYCHNHKWSIEEGEYRWYVPSIVKRTVSESAKFDELCQSAKKLSIEEKGDGTSRLKAEAGSNH